MKRFIRYLYEYKHEERIRNVGFVKVWQDETKTEIQIKSKEINIDSNNNISKWVVLSGEEGYSKMHVDTGETVIVPGMVGGDDRYETVCGCLLIAENSHYYAALWNEEDPRKFDPQTLTDIVVASEAETKQAVNTQAEEAAEVAEKVVIGEAAAAETDTADIPTYRITKIRRKEISVLPRSEWTLANNNFLLHGYYNYRHLVLIDDGETLKLGVPGIYHEKEARAALAFGFPEFIGEEDVKLVLEPEEHHIGQQFGYWCRPVKRPTL